MGAKGKGAHVAGQSLDESTDVLELSPADPHITR